MKILHSYSWVVVLVLMTIACAHDAKLVPLNLLEYGFPITIMAPDSPEIKTMDLVVQKDLTVKKGEDYYVQIFMSDASTNKAGKVKAENLEITKSNPYFSKLILDEDQGYIYEMKLDSAHTVYGFKYFKIQGDKEFDFQTGLTGLFNEHQVRRMYEAVQ
ncbi:MAG: hypothetical protein KDC28_01900 [Saprospiraceae bacterium]|nr:hypothetical protein [Saprospiraceae bacterium]MCB9320567.1 hypothetical protein [Lewinellaceae bacterium]